MEKYKLFCDLDGVLIDFDKGYTKLTGKDNRGKFNNGPEFWAPIDKAGMDFWVNLEWMSDGKKLWNYIKDYKPKLLSAPSKKNESRVGKHKWVNRELPGVELILRSASNKREFAEKDTILIDDRPENIEQWKESGGIGILHTSASETIKELKKLGL